jgi:hypothetical protein
VNDALNRDLSAKIYTDGSQLMAGLTFVSRETEILACNMLGRKLLQKQLQEETLYALPLALTADILIVTLSNADGRLSRKLIWHTDN